MSELLVATLNVSFDDGDEVGDNSGKNKIVLQQMTQRFDGLGQLLARCFPSTGIDFVVSTGDLTVGEVRLQLVSETLKFSNSDSASLKLPGAFDVQVTPQVLMRKTKNNYGETVIKPASGIDLSFDQDTEKVIATKSGTPVAIYGACFVHYSAYYQVLYYKPGLVNIPVGGTDYALIVQLGSIYAYNDYDVQVLEMKLDTKSSPQWVEYARVTSKIVLDERGFWEYPENWEGTYQSNKDKLPDRKADFEKGTFDYFTNTYTIDADQSFTDERVHCIITVNTIGSIRYEDFNNGGDGYTSWNMPYFGLNYDPTYTCKFIDAPGGKKANSAEDFEYDMNHRTWRDVFIEVDKDAIKKRLRVQYPNIKNDNGNAL